MNRKAEHNIRRKLKVLEFAAVHGNVSRTYRIFGISRDTYYRWKRDYSAKGGNRLINSKTCPENPKIGVAPEIEEKILYLRKHFHFGPTQVSGYLHRYHNMQVSSLGVYSVLKRNGMNHLPNT